MGLVEDIRQNYLEIKDRIDEVSSRQLGQPEPVKIIVVTKRKSAEVVQAAIEAGVDTFGENYAEEAAAKIAEIGQVGVHWHMIGHIQSRKAGLVAANFEMVHSIDTFRIAEKISSFAVANARKIQILLECNVSGEAAKFGFDASNTSTWPNLLEEARQIAILPNLQLCGLMTMPPYSEDPDASRPFFAKLRELRDWLQAQDPGLTLPQLSMGTSGDHLAAVREGATMVRIGTAILGSRS